MKHCFLWHFLILSANHLNKIRFCNCMKHWKLFTAFLNQGNFSIALSGVKHVKQRSSIKTVLKKSSYQFSWLQSELISLHSSKFSVVRLMEINVGKPKYSKLQSLPNLSKFHVISLYHLILNMFNTVAQRLFSHSEVRNDFLRTTAATHSLVYWTKQNSFC